MKISIYSMTYTILSTKVGECFQPSRQIRSNSNCRPQQILTIKHGKLLFWVKNDALKGFQFELNKSLQSAAIDCCDMWLPACLYVLCIVLLELTKSISSTSPVSFRRTFSCVFCWEMRSVSTQTFASFSTHMSLSCGSSSATITLADMDRWSASRRGGIWGGMISEVHAHLRCDCECHPHDDYAEKEEGNACYDDAQSHETNIF